MKLKIFLNLIFIGILSSETFCQIVLPGDKYFTNVDFDTLQKVFNKLNNYDKRYFLESIPKYYFQNKINKVPEWLKSGVANAVASNDQQLVMRAIYVSKKLQIEESIPALTDLYRNLRYKFGANDSLFREPILNTLLAIDSYTATIFLSDLLSNPTKFKPDINQAIMIIGPTCGREIIPLIDNFCNNLENEIQSDSAKNVDSNKKAENSVNDNGYKNTLFLAKNLKTDILLKDGKYE